MIGSYGSDFMFNFIYKKKKKVYDKWFLLIFSTLVVCVGIVDELLKGTSALDEDVEVSSNNFFDDMNFYKCVVDAYNKENNTEYDYSYNLADDELKLVTKVDCSSNELFNENKIKSVRGLEKLLSLVHLDISGNRITKLDLSSNKELMYINLSNNELTELDVSNNLKLTDLNVGNNNLTSLDLSTNNELLNLNTVGNFFDKTISLYKGESAKLNNFIMFPYNIDLELIDLFSNNPSVVSVDEDRIINALDGGSSLVDSKIKTDILTYNISSNFINVIDISSDEYIIDYVEKFIYIGNDYLDVDKIDIVKFNLNENNNKLQILDNERKIVTELDILKLDFGNLNVVDSVININGEFLYEDFISNITMNHEFIYRIKDDEKEVNIGSKIYDGMILEIYFNNILLDTYEINIL